MGRKRKAGRVSGSGPSSSVPASDSAPVYNGPEFHTYRYKTFYSSRKIVEGRFVKFDGFRELGLENLFDQIGWKELMEISEPIYPRLVRAFYADFIWNEDDETILYTLKGIEIKIDRNYIANLFNVPEGQNVRKMGLCSERIRGSIETCRAIFENPSMEAWPVDIKGIMLPIKSRLIHLIITHNIIPRAGHRDVVTLTDQYFLSCILEGIRTSFPFLMLTLMLRTRDSARDGSLPFGMLLTRIFKDHKIPLDDEMDVENPKEIIDHKTLSRMGFVKRDNGIWVRKEAVENVQGLRQPQMQEGADRMEEVGEQEGEEEVQPNQEEQSIRECLLSHLRSSEARIFAHVDSRLNRLQQQQEASIEILQQQQQASISQLQQWMDARFQSLSLQLSSFQQQPSQSQPPRSSSPPPPPDFYY